MIRKDEHWFVQEDLRPAPGTTLARQPQQLDPDTTSPSGCSGHRSVRLRSLFDGSQDTAMKSPPTRSSTVVARPDVAAPNLPSTSAARPSTPFIGENYHGPARLPPWLLAVR
jgi:hypothetical protein